MKLQLPDIRSKLVTSKQYTHVSMNLKQTGLQKDVFQIGVLLFKANFSIEKIYETQNRDSALIAGRVIDPAFKPCMVVLNRDQGELQCVLGPNRIYYDSSDGDEYKVWVPADYLRMNRHPLISCPQPMIEVFGTSNNNRDVKLANTLEGMALNQDIDQSQDPMNLGNRGVELGFRNFLVPEVDYIGLSMSLQEALSPSTSLLANTKSGNGGNQPTLGGFARPPARLENGLTRNTAQQRSQMTSATGHVPEIRKTKAQLARERAAAEKLA